MKDLMPNNEVCISTKAVPLPYPSNLCVCPFHRRVVYNDDISCDAFNE